ncbi:MAG: MBOAT family protein, partial [bacterium]|nr:MBOAT family protein [bacterium]
FPLAVLAYYTLPLRVRRIFLLVAGYYFYMCFKPEYVLLLAGSTVVDFYLAQWVARRRSRGAGRLGARGILVLGLIHNVGLLAGFKYLDFFNETLAALLRPFNILYPVESLGILLPIGISYFTFKKISYLIEVYRETHAPEKRLIGFALYVSFFPEITAGPIDRAHRLLPQFYKDRVFDYRRVTEGLKLMAWGFFKKVVIADRLAAFVSRVYDSPQQFEGPALAMATVYFSLQIYCDFSGYSDIAIGAGRVLGFDLMENFNRPYFAHSIGDFWKRWHISLSSWLMDYLFLPIAYRVSRKIKAPRLVGVKAETWAYITGIMITFILCGIWHGAAWTFVIWGGLHGLFLALSFGTKKIRRKINKRLELKRFPFLRGAFRMSVTFMMVTFAWIFFRADSLSDAFYIVSHLFSGWSSVLNVNGLLSAFHLGLLKKELAVAAISIGFMLWVHAARKEKTFEVWVAAQKDFPRWVFYVCLLFWLLAFGDTGAGEFIYFRF